MLQELLAILAESRSLGFLGPGPLEAHVEHARGLAAALLATLGAPADAAAGQAVDLGAGGGVPGLVLGALWPQTAILLLDANGRRTRFLEGAVARLGWSSRVTVRCSRAETAGREPALRGGFDVVFARGFGPPATTAECAAPFLRVGGLLVVSEPPPPTAAAAERWPPEGCAELGLEPARRFDTPIASQVLLQVASCPDRFPRRDGVPAKRPLF